MVRLPNLVTLSVDIEVFDAIATLIRRGISGAPVVSTDGSFLGVFSEKCVMRVLVEAAYEQHPVGRIDAWLDTDCRAVSEDADIFSIADIFLRTSYRRLPVLRDGKLLGQISRRDVVSAVHRLIQEADSKQTAFQRLSVLMETKHRR